MVVVLHRAVFSPIWVLANVLYPLYPLFHVEHLLGCIMSKLHGFRTVTPFVQGVHLDWASLLLVGQGSPEVQSWVSSQIGDEFPLVRTVRGSRRQLVEMAGFLTDHTPLSKLQILLDRNGTKVDLGGKSFLRPLALSYAISVLRRIAALMSVNGGRVHITRLDWALQIPVDVQKGCTFASILQVVEAMGFTIDALPSRETLNAGVSAMGSSAYRGWSDSVPWVDEETGRKVVATDRLTVVVYDASVLVGAGVLPVIRVEVREQLARRQYVDRRSFSMQPKTFALLRQLEKLTGSDSGPLPQSEGILFRDEPSRIACKAALVRAVSALVRNMVEVSPGQLLPRHGRGSAKSRAAIYELALEACQGDLTEVLERWPILSVVLEESTAAHSAPPPQGVLMLPCVRP